MDPDRDSFSSQFFRRGFFGHNTWSSSTKRAKIDMYAGMVADAINTYDYRDIEKAKKYALENTPRDVYFRLRDTFNVLGDIYEDFINYLEDNCKPID